MDQQRTYLKDYQKPDFECARLELDFVLNDDFCRVRSTALYHRRRADAALILDGVHLDLISLKLNGQLVSESDFEKSEKDLKLKNVPEEFSLEIITQTQPQKNTSLEGLYKSGGGFVTQCEAQGFRKITYFLDRPDVMTSYRVRIEADKKKYPVLLSNGNRLTARDLPDGRHEAVWEDPHKKPCYLFALVAADLGMIKDSFTTMSGRQVNLEIYASHGKQDRCRHAMASVKNAMRWDEERFGREYDLGDYMIVAADDFNAGAMENKGLNIFNSRLVLADSQSATDLDFYNIESVIGHEYFHNWTGNRVTLRDWCQLSLKEGLTVFRDQEFSGDLTDRGVQRIKDVDSLRDRQFPEDAGPNAHPVRPESYVAIDNFFTTTIYEKGAELIRMMQTTVGRKGFRKGMDLYFERHDGQAVTTEDFAAAIADANGADFTQLRRWYSQAGTPRLRVTEKFSDGQYELTLKQTCPPTPGQAAKQPFQIPIRLGLLNEAGEELPIESLKVRFNSDQLPLIELRETEETFQWVGLQARPHLSLLREFSAPVVLDWEREDKDLFFLMAKDTDGFNRREAAQEAARIILSKMIANFSQGNDAQPDIAYVGAWTEALNAPLDPAYQACLLELPSDVMILQREKILQPSAFRAARQILKRTLATTNRQALQKLYAKWNDVDAEKQDSKTAGHRALKNLALDFLAAIGDVEAMDLVWSQFKNAENMTDRMIALALITDSTDPRRAEALKIFHDDWKSDGLVLNKWFTAQASSSQPGTLENIRTLTKHPDFLITNPNHVYSLLRVFGNNLTAFHDSQQPGYSFYANQIISIDSFNPQVAARLCSAFNVVGKLPANLKSQALGEIQRILSAPNLSKNARELLEPVLKDQ